jgi:glycerol-3-phosphate acyltransferase PlsY
MEMLFNHNVHFYLIAYLLGGIPFGLLLAKFFAGINITASGSGSIGATNVLRVVKEINPSLAKKLGIATLALDALKGVIIVVIAKYLGMSEGIQWTVAVLAVMGHCFSPYMWFEGGKGVATGMGVMAVMLPIPTVIALVVWGSAAKTIRISSISSMLGLLALIVAAFILYPTMIHAPILVIAFILFYKHIPNFIRLFQGEEKKVG